jgi:hypothetical protein
MDAAGAVDAERAHRSLENRTERGFIKAPTRIIPSREKEKQNETRQPALHTKSRTFPIQKNQLISYPPAEFLLSSC